MRNLIFTCGITLDVMDLMNTLFLVVFTCWVPRGTLDWDLALQY